MNTFILSYTNYWKGWLRWRCMLIVVCHFVIICPFSIYGFRPLLWHLQTLLTYQTYGSPRPGIGDLSQVWLPRLDILIFLISRILILWFTSFWLWVYPLKVIAETVICCVFFSDCSFFWYWRNCWPQFKMSIHYYLSPKITGNI